MLDSYRNHAEYQTQQLVKNPLCEYEFDLATEGIALMKENERRLEKIREDLMITSHNPSNNSEIQINRNSREMALSKIEEITIKLNDLELTKKEAEESIKKLDVSGSIKKSN